MALTSAELVMARNAVEILLNAFRGLKEAESILTALSSGTTMVDELMAEIRRLETLREEAQSATLVHRQAMEVSRAEATKVIAQTMEESSKALAEHAERVQALQAELTRAQAEHARVLAEANDQQIRTMAAMRQKQREELEAATHEHDARMDELTRERIAAEEQLEITRTALATLKAQIKGLG